MWMSRRLRWQFSRFLSMVWSWRCVWNPFFKMRMSRRLQWRSLQIFFNVLVMENVSEIHSSKCKCPGGYDGDPHVFCSKPWLFYISRIKFFTTQQLNLCRRDTRYGYFEFAKKLWNMPKQHIFWRKMFLFDNPAVEIWACLAMFKLKSPTLFFWPLYTAWYWDFDLKSWIVDFFTRFTRKKTPQNNFSSQNFSVENNYFSVV